MEIKLDIPNYDSSTVITYQWEPNFDIDVIYHENNVLLRANKAGLLSLANHLLNLAQEEIPIGYHLHFDEYNSLNEGSVELIVEKKG